MTRARLRYRPLLLALLLTACERPFVEEPLPEIAVVTPDLGVVQTDPVVPIRLRVTSRLAAVRVDVDGEAATFDPETQTWADTLTLQRGLNRFVLTTVDGDGLVGRDTLYAVHLQPRIETDVAPLPEPRAGHAAVALADGRVLVTGGTSFSDLDDARGTAFVFDPETDQWSTLSHRMAAARVGHTAALLPSGRVLIVGGAERGAFERVEDLIETVEVFTPWTMQFALVPVGNTTFPIRRAFHTMSVRQESLNGPSYVDLLFGRGDVRYDPPTLRVKPDLRRFIFRNDSLVAVIRSAADADLQHSDQLLYGHTQTPLGAFDPPSPGSYLVVGSYFDEEGGGERAAEAAFVLDYTRLGLLERDAQPLDPSRTRHAAVRLQPGLVLILGGRGPAITSARDDLVLFAEEANRYFRFPSSIRLPFPIFGHTATILPSQRILLAGGFSSTGNATSQTAYLVF